jgi:proteasome maturation protein
LSLKARFLKPGIQHKSSFPINGPYRGCNNLQRGFYNVANTLSPLHAIEQVLEEKDYFTEERQLEVLRYTQGFAAPIKICLERKLFSRPLRLPGLPSSQILLDVALGNDESIDFEDYLGGFH